MVRELLKHSSISLALILAGCSPVLTKYPELNAEKKRDTVAIARFVDGYYLEQFEACDGKDDKGDYLTICIDPPPMALTVEIKSTLFGPKIPTKLIIATTDHFGLQTYDFENPQYFILKIKSDGDSYVMPRYEKDQLSATGDGRYLTPVFSDEGIWWLPCSLKKLVVELKPSEIPDIFKTPVKEFEEYELKQNPTEYTVDNGLVMPRHFIFSDDVAKALGETKQKELSKCEE